MKCTGRRAEYYKKIKRRNRWVGCLSVILILLSVFALKLYYDQLNKKPEYFVQQYEAVHYETSIYRGNLYAEQLCVPESDTLSEDRVLDTASLYSAALFNVNAARTEYAYDVHRKLYPASTTKILTALVALNHGSLTDAVTVAAEADARNFARDEATCGIHAGDKLTLGDLLNGLLLHSGNDNAVAIAMHIGGSIDQFAQMMNDQAKALMAVESHFVNPSGLHNEEHYTTAYDLYLIFNECIKHEEFVNIINSKSYTAQIAGADGAARSVTWEASNYYAKGEAKFPDNVTYIGGKTGTTRAAGNCLILMTKDGEDPYISIIMGASSKPLLYQDMTKLLNTI